MKIYENGIISAHMHEPVLLNEAIEALHIKSQAWYIDATVGSGGHSEEILKRGGNLIGIEADPEMFKIAEKRLLGVPRTGVFHLVNKNFTEIDKILQSFEVDKVDGILFDLGISTLHYSLSRRGFSFSKPEEPLDMRLNSNTQEVKASDLVNALRFDQLRDLFLEVMDYSEANWLAKQIVQKRKLKRIDTVVDLLDIVSLLRTKGNTHPATKVFMALRMAVNTELENINFALPIAFSLLAPGGKMAVITFHSTEDRAVKKLFIEFEQQNLGKIDHKKAILPTKEEIDRNPSSRSAQLRVISKI